MRYRATTRMTIYSNTQSTGLYKMAQYKISLWLKHCRHSLFNDCEYPSRYVVLTQARD
jgi:hypothetical protein